MSAALRLFHPQSGLLAFEEAVQVEGGFDLAELTAAELLHDRPGLARGLAHYAAVREIDRYLCRWLLRDVGDLSALVQLAAEPELAGREVAVERGWPADPVVTRIARIARQHRTLPPALDAALRRLDLGALEPGLRERARTAVRVLRALAGLWAEWLGRLRPHGTAHVSRPLMLRTYATDWGIDTGGSERLRNVDFVVGGPIPAAEVAFWAEEGVPSERIRALASRGYHVVEARAIRVGPAGFLTRVLPGLLRATPLFVRLALAEGWWLTPVRTLIADVLLWREIAHDVSPRAFLLYNDVHPAGMARTLALRRNGVSVVQYEHANSWAFDEHGWVPDFINAFSVVDAVATWGPAHTEAFRAHRGVIGDVWELGCLWSEHARRVRDEPELRDVFRAKIEEAHGASFGGYEHVVGVFDTSVAPLLLRREDMVAFYEGVVELARRLPHALFLVKPKRPLAELLAGEGVVAEIAEVPNLAVVGELFETAAVVGLCNLSVNACYTSPAVETIGAGRPALHFDPTNRFPEAFLRGIPRFVATGVDELAELVAECLFANPAESAEDLRQRFSRLEGRFDGLAITRLRNRLRELLDGSGA